VRHQVDWQHGQSADDVSAIELAPRLLAALKAQHSVWQRVKVALLSHFAARLRAQLAEERATAAAAAMEAEQREVTLQRSLQGVQKVSLVIIDAVSWMTADCVVLGSVTRRSVFTVLRGYL
jgi:hypothetical protein